MVWEWTDEEFCVFMIFFENGCVFACAVVHVRLCFLKFASHAGGQDSLRACWYPSRARQRDMNPAGPKWLRVKGVGLVEHWAGGRGGKVGWGGRWDLEV